jgi:hypothetical protein
MPSPMAWIDGDLDMIVITNYGAERVEPFVLWNDGKGKFSHAQLDTILDRDHALFMAKGLKHRSKYIKCENRRCGRGWPSGSGASD